jgi:hypothetical protein
MLIKLFFGYLTYSTKAIQSSGINNDKDNRHKNRSYNQPNANPAETLYTSGIPTFDNVPRVRVVLWTWGTTQCAKRKHFILVDKKIHSTVQIN